MPLQRLKGTDDAYQVLLIEDEAAHRRLQKSILQAPEFDITEAEDGEEALKVIQKNDFDVILLDKSMPGLSGDQVCSKIRNELQQCLTPIIMVTGSSSFSDLEASLEAGANDFIRKPYDPIELLARVRSAANHKRLTDQLDSSTSVLFSLARMVEAKDGGTGMHCTRLEYMASIFGQDLSLNQHELLALKNGGVLHDIGKLGIPDSILLKKDKLTEQEWDCMRKHPVIGVDLCQNLRTLKMCLPIIKYHHEKWDGSGYPDGLKGEETPYLARVFQVLDIYDALANERPYKKAFSHDMVIQIFEEEVSKGWRDPKLVARFIQLLKSKPESLQIPKKLQIAQ